MPPPRMQSFLPPMAGGQRQQIMPGGYNIANLPGDAMNEVGWQMFPGLYGNRPTVASGQRQVPAGQSPQQAQAPAPQQQAAQPAPPLPPPVGAAQNAPAPYSGPPTVGAGSGMIGGMPNMLMNLVGMANRATPPQQSSGGMSLQEVQNIVNQANRPNLPPSAAAPQGPSIQQMLTQAMNPQNPVAQVNDQFGGQMPSLSQWMANIDQFRPFTTPGLQQYVSNHAANPGNTGQLYAGLAESYVPYLQNQVLGHQAATSRAQQQGSLGLGLGTQALQALDMGRLNAQTMAEINRPQQTFQNNLYTAGIGAMMQANPGVPMPQLMQQLAQQGMPPPVGAPGGPSMNMYSGSGGMAGPYINSGGQGQGQTPAPAPGQPQGQGPGFVPPGLAGRVTPQQFQQLQQIFLSTARDVGGNAGGPGQQQGGSPTVPQGQENAALTAIVQRAMAEGIPAPAIHAWLGSRNSGFTPQALQGWFGQRISTTVPHGMFGFPDQATADTLNSYRNALDNAGGNVGTTYGPLGDAFALRPMFPWR
jgi:hypothetical protein